MTTVSTAQTSFTGGEWAPSLYARSDLAKYSTAVRRMRNFTVQPHGGASNRPGTKFVAEVETSSKFTRLVPFQFSVVQSYILEFGDKYIRIIKDGGLVLSSGTPVKVVTTYAEADLPLLKFCQSADTLYITHPSYAPAKLTRSSHTAWTLSTITFQAAISPPTVTANAATPTQNWHYVVTAVNANGNESVASNVIHNDLAKTFTWAEVVGAVVYNVYRDYGTNSGKFYFISSAKSYGVSGGLYYDDNKKQEDPARSPPEAKTFFASADNYPGCATFFEQSLVFARTNTKPQTLFGSVAGDFENMNTSYPLKDDDAYEFTINSDQVNEIRHLVPLNVLMAMTAGGEWKITGRDGKISPLNIDIKRQGQNGCENVSPVVVGDSVLYLSGTTVRDLRYALEVDGYTGNDLTILANHLFKNYEVTAWAYQQFPDSVLWCVRNDGKLIALTTKREHEVQAWHVHDTDGIFESVAVIQTGVGSSEVYFVVRRTINGTSKRYIEYLAPRLPANSLFEVDIRDAFFVDCGLSLDTPLTITAITKANPAVVASAAHGLSNGDVVDFAEMVGMTELQNVRGVVANKDTNTFEIEGVDSTNYGTFTSGVCRKAVKTISGLSHLEGKEVAVLANGNVINNLTVASGAITLPTYASRVHVGLSYTCEIETMDFELATQTGNTIQDRIRAIPSVLARLENTRELFIGPSFDEEKLVEVPFRTSEPIGAPISLYTGDKEIFLEPGEFREGRICLKTVSPVPITILALIPRIEAGEN